MQNNRLGIINSIESGDNLGNTRLKIIEIMQDILQKPADFEATWHPLGFVHVSLGNFENKNLRLHIWREDGKKSPLLTSSIHNHIRDLTSFVLLGKIRNNYINCYPEAENPSHRVYQVIYDGRVNLLKPTSTLIAYEKVESAVFMSPEQYIIKSGEFHYTELLSQIAVTVVVAEKTTDSPPQTLGPIEKNSFRMSRILVSPPELRRNMQEILPLI
jgi:hypothetical protein